MLPCDYPCTAPGSYCATGASDLVDGLEDVITGGGADESAPITVACPEGTRVNASLFHHMPDLTFPSVAAYLTFRSPPPSLEGDDTSRYEK